MNEINDELQTEKMQCKVNSGKCDRSREQGLISTMSDLGRLLRNCKVITITDEEFAPTGFFLPDNFWEIDFYGIDLDQHVTEALTF